MPTLYLTEQGATLSKDHNRLVVEMGSTVITEIHEFKVERVVIFGHIQLTTQVIAYLLNRGIDTAFLTMQGKLKGRLAPIATKNVPLRVRQYDFARDSSFPLTIAKAMVIGKLANSASVLARFQRNHPEYNFSDPISNLVALRSDAYRKQTMDSLRGVEGHGAALYFQCFSKMLLGELQFNKRTRQPPTDPVNAMLSFGYTLLYNEAISALVSIGFDPYIGFYHGINYGRCSLALDLIEEFRHLVIDRLIINLVNNKVLVANDFTAMPDGAVYLEGEARKKFLKEYEKYVTTEFTHLRTAEKTSFRRALHDQALELQRTLMRSQPYTPFEGWH
ncbi:MAG: CRISPR-associated endonuclease Cas1 [Blastocatellia bacterium]|nr:CRISPR-associated endonuclease Cas1 [Blastocatellia bacterium]